MGFEQMLKRISPKLKGIVYKFPENSFDKDDLYSEAVAHLWIDYREGKLLDKTDSYILQSCYFYLRNYVRKFQDKMALVSINASINEEEVAWQDVLSVKEEVAQEDGGGIDALMEEVFNGDLDRKEKEVVFYYLQGLTTRGIGDKLGLSHVSVVKIEDKIRQKCKKFKDSLQKQLPKGDF